MSTDHNNEPVDAKRKRSALRLVANLAWLLAAGSILAPSLLDLSSAGRGAANVLFGLAFFVFFLCAIAGFARATKHLRTRGMTALSKDPTHPSENS